MLRGLTASYPNAPERTKTALSRSLPLSSLLLHSTSRRRWNLEMREKVTWVEQATANVTVSPIIDKFDNPWLEQLPRQ
jgi:hypothetical protein